MKSITKNFIYIKLAILSLAIPLGMTAYAGSDGQSDPPFNAADVGIQTQFKGFYLIDMKSHEKNLELFKNKDVTFLKTINKLNKAAEAVLKNETYSVTFHKNNKAPSGDVHDFYSQSPYYFVDEAGVAFKQVGKRNAETKNYKDKEQLGKLISDLQTLSLAYFYVKDERFAQKARLLMETWFINKATRMNPNMNFAQAKPGENMGNFSGIIESRELVFIPDILHLLEGSQAINTGFLTAIQGWFKDYLSWLETSKLGKVASIQKNNQGNYYDLQVYVISLFVGRDINQVKEMIAKNTTEKICSQINERGEQYLELKRATPIGYSFFNLKALFLIALLSENINGMDLWNYSCNGSSLKSALQWIDQQYDNQLKNRKANTKFETIRPGHLRNFYSVALPRMNGLGLSGEKIAHEISGVSNTYFLF